MIATTDLLIGELLRRLVVDLLRIILEYGGPVGSILTGLGVIFIFWQAYQRSKQFTTEVEDKLTGEYREIVASGPTEAFLGGEIDDNKDNINEDLHRYLDLTNQQIWLRCYGRVSRSTWENWDDGIQEHIKNQQIAETFDEINSTYTSGKPYDMRNAEHFSGLSKYLNQLSKDKRDPIFWEDTEWWQIRRRLAKWWAQKRIADDSESVVDPHDLSDDWSSCDWVEKTCWYSASPESDED
jgi:hypothetical protein